MPTVIEAELLGRVQVLEEAQLEQAKRSLERHKTKLATLTEKKQADAAVVDALASTITARYQNALKNLPQFVADRVDQYCEEVNAALRVRGQEAQKPADLPSRDDIKAYSSRQEKLKQELLAAIFEHISPRLRKIVEHDDGLLKRHVLPDLARIKEHGFQEHTGDFRTDRQHPLTIHEDQITASTNGLFSDTPLPPKLRVVLEKQRGFERDYLNKMLDGGILGRCFSDLLHELDLTSPSAWPEDMKKYNELWSALPREGIDLWLGDNPKGWTGRQQKELDGTKRETERLSGYITGEQERLRAEAAAATR